MAYSIVVLPAARDDLEKIWDENDDAAADIEEWLYRISGDQDLLDSLTAHDYGIYKSKPYHVSKWAEHWVTKNFWRLKIWGPSEAYRTIYCYRLGIQRYIVLGIPPRDFDYRLDHPSRNASWPTMLPFERIRLGVDEEAATLSSSGSSDQVFYLFAQAREQAPLPIGAVFLRDLVEDHRRNPDRRDAMERARARVDGALNAPTLHLAVGGLLMVRDTI